MAQIPLIKAHQVLKSVKRTSGLYYKIKFVLFIKDIF